ncbi:MAG: glycosyltransferase, partial [Chthoniobacterales bacterium]|nr:glycosyltransferase [Chthoniobacterales bacterium]
NIYDVQKYLQVHNIAHAVAHPLYSSDEKLTSLHVKKLVLLFRHFEAPNGKYPALLTDCLQWTLRHLTSESIFRFAEEVSLEPTHERAWQKVFVGGSDDSGGLYMGTTWTETPRTASVKEFLDSIREGRVRAGGSAGSPLRMAHNTYSTAFSYVKSKLFRNPQDPGSMLLEKVCSRFLEGRDPTEFSLSEKLSFLAQGVASGKIFEFARAGQSSFWRELGTYFSQPAVRAAIARVTSGVNEPERRAFLMADLISGQLGYRLTSHFLEQMRVGRILESLQMAAPILPILLLLSPYLQSFRFPRRQRLREICHSLCGEVPPQLQNAKRAWFTDTLDEINGVTTTIRKMAAAGLQAGFDITVVACRSNPVQYSDIKVQNFQPIGEFELPEYELQRLSFPPLLQILDWIEREKITQLIISTPGPVGLTALLAAEMLGLPSASIYHTDFPQYVGILTDDAFLETLTWNYMHWFYSKQERVFVNCEDYRQCWIRRGIPAERLR